MTTYRHTQIGFVAIYGIAALVLILVIVSALSPSARPSLIVATLLLAMAVLFPR